ncbi:MAG: hypothetical protein QXK65_01985 [Candidatus Micrarchaeaceae archaeon]
MNKKTVYTEQNNLYDKIKRAQKSFNEKDYKNSLRYLDDIIGKYTLDTESLGTLYFMKGVSLIELNDDSKAKEYINTAISFSEKPLFYIVRANMEFKEGNNEKALSDFNKAISKGGESRFAFFGRGLVYQNMRKWKNAVEDFEKAIYLGESSPDVFHELGVALGNLGETDKSLGAFEKAISMNPSDVSSYVEECKVLINAGRFADIRRVVDSARKLKLDDADLHLASAISYATNGDAEQASLELLTVVGIDGKFDSAAIEILLKIGDYAGVATIYRKWSKAYPHIPGFYKQEMKAVAMAIDSIKDEESELYKSFTDLLLDLSEAYKSAVLKMTEAGMDFEDTHSAFEKLRKLQRGLHRGSLEEAEIYEKLSRKYPHLPGPYRFAEEAFYRAAEEENKPELLESATRMGSLRNKLVEDIEQKRADN